MPSKSLFDELLGRVRQGDAAAQIDLFERYKHQLAKVASRHLDKQVQHLVEPDDIVLTAMKSFFIRYAEGKYQVDDWDEFWALITEIVKNKCRVRRRYHFADKRSVAEVQPLLDRDLPDNTDGQVALEVLEQWRTNIQREQTREVLSLLWRGHTQKEIAQILDCGERTVRREFSLIKKVLQRIHDESCEAEAE